MLKSNYMTIAEASEKWDLSIRQVQHLCTLGLVDGAVRFGRAWMIPKDNPKPVDRRTKQAKVQNSTNLPMPRKSPFLVMTDLYTKAGSADECIAALADQPEAQALYAAEIAYCRGEIDKVIEQAQYFLSSRSGFYAINAGGMLLALSAMWKGDINLYRQAKVHICESPVKNDLDRDIMSLSLACIDSAVQDISNYPEWFTRGQFEHLHPDSHPAAKVFYVKYLLIYAQELAKGQFTFPGVTGMGWLRVIPYIAEPLIARVVAEKVVIPEIYLRLLTAIVYHQTGDDARATFHIDKAIALALPDGLLGILAEHRRQFDNLLDERLELASPQAFKKYKALDKDLVNGWITLHNSLLSRSVSNALSIQEREVARLAAFGLTNVQIAEQLHVSVDYAKQTVFDSMTKTGVMKRQELGAYV